MARPFLLIGKEYRLNDSDYPTYEGVVFASDEAFYFVGKHAVTLADFRGRPGRVGLLAATSAAVQARLRDPEAERQTEQTAHDLFRCPADQVPPVLTTRPDWLTRDAPPPVLRVPRAAVFSVTIPWFWLNNRLAVQTEQIKFGVVFNPFRRSRIRRFLAEQGWVVS